MEELKRFAQPGVPIIVVGTKCDLEERAISPNFLHSLCGTSRSSSGQNADSSPFLQANTFTGELTPVRDSGKLLSPRGSVYSMTPSLPSSPLSSHSVDMNFTEYIETSAKLGHSMIRLQLEILRAGVRFLAKFAIMYLFSPSLFFFFIYLFVQIFFFFFFLFDLSLSFSHAFWRTIGEDGWDKLEKD